MERYGKQTGLALPAVREDGCRCCVNLNISCEKWQQPQEGEVDDGLDKNTLLVVKMAKAKV